MAFCLAVLLLLFVIGMDVISGDGGVPVIKGDKKSMVETTVGKNITLPCQVEKSMNLMFSWHKDGSLVQSDMEHYKVTRKGVLHIFNTTVEDSGTYVCQAVNGFGTVDISISLVVQGDGDHNSLLVDDGLGAKPLFASPHTHHRNSFQEPTNGTVKFNCSANGHPRPEYLWKKDGQVLTPDHFVGNMKVHRGVLFLTKLQKDNMGTYVCLVRNRFGEINATFVLEVVGRNPKKPQLPGLHPLNTTVESGGTASFQCRVLSEVTPHIQWLKKLDQVIEDSETHIEFEGAHFQVLKSSEVVERSEGLYLNKLILPEVTEADSGMYICVAANAMGYNHKEAFLTVQKRQQVWDSGRGEAYDGAGMGNVSLTLVITVPTVVIVVVVVVFIAMHCRGRYTTPSTCPAQSKPLMSSSAPAAPAPPANTTTTMMHNGTYVVAPPSATAVIPSKCTLNGNCKPQWVDLPPSYPIPCGNPPPPPPSSSWSSSQTTVPQQHYRRSGAATPSSSAGETGRSATSVSLPKVHHHHHQHRYHPSQCVYYS